MSSRTRSVCQAERGRSCAVTRMGERGGTGRPGTGGSGRGTRRTGGPARRSWPPAVGRADPVSGWRVREVVAHVTMPFRMSLGRTVVELVRCAGGSTVWRTGARAATRHRCRPSSCSPRGATTSPTRGRHRVAVTTARSPTTSFTASTSPSVSGSTAGYRRGGSRWYWPGCSRRNIAYFGTDLTGVQLRATDLDWSHGAGTPVRGLAQDLLLVVCGRRLPPGRLTGDAADSFHPGVRKRLERNPGLSRHHDLQESNVLEDRQCPSRRRRGGRACAGTGASSPPAAVPWRPATGGSGRRGGGGGATASRSRAVIRSRAASRLASCARCSLAATVSTPSTSRPASRSSARARSDSGGWARRPGRSSARPGSRWC